MSLFLPKEDYDSLSGGIQMIPILKLVRKEYYSFVLRNLLLPVEKDKIFKFFNEMTEESKKKIKRLTIVSKEDAEALAERCTKQEKIMYDGKIIKYSGVIPTMEIMRWPANTPLANYSFNKLTKHKYSQCGDVVVGTYVIPIMFSKSPMSVCKTGSTCLEKNSICVCNIGNGCCCQSAKCNCKTECKCDEFEIQLSGVDSIFHMQDLEVHETYSEDIRMNLYLHLRYQF